MLLFALIAVFLVIGVVAVVSFGITWLPVIFAGGLVTLIVWAITKYGKINPSIITPASSNGRHLESGRYADSNVKQFNFPKLEER